MFAKCPKTKAELVLRVLFIQGYNSLVDFGYKKHFRVHHGKNEFARGNSHINGIESFWDYAKNRLENLLYQLMESSKRRGNQSALRTCMGIRDWLDTNPNPTEGECELRELELNQL